MCCGKAWDHTEWRINITVITGWGGNTPGVTQTNVKYSTGDTQSGTYMHLCGQTDFSVENSGVTQRGVDTPEVTRLGPERWRVVLWRGQRPGLGQMGPF